MINNWVTIIVATGPLK